MTRTSIIDLLTPWAEKYPESVAAATPPGPDRVSLSKVRLLGEIGAARERYLAADVRPGDRIVLIAPTCPEFLIEFFGAHAAGLVVVAVNPLSTVRELDYILADSEARVLVAHPASAEAGKTAAAQHDVDFRTVSIVGNEGPAPRWGPIPMSPSTVLISPGTTSRPSSTPRARRASRRGRC